MCFLYLVSKEGKASTQNVITKTVCKANTWPQKDKKTKKKKMPKARIILHSMDWEVHGINDWFHGNLSLTFRGAFMRLRTWSTVTVVFSLCLLTRKSHTRSLQVKQNTFPISLSHGDLLQTNCFYYPFMLFQIEFHLEIVITTFVISD